MAAVPAQTADFCLSWVLSTNKHFIWCVRKRVDASRQKEVSRRQYVWCLRKREFWFPNPTIRFRERGRERGRMSSPGRSPPPEPESTEKSVTQEPAVSTLALAIADETSRSEDPATAVTVVGCGGRSEESGGPANGSCVSRMKDNGFGVVPGRLVRVAFGLRVSASVLCLVSFSVMSADDTPGWTGDFFGRYREYRCGPKSSNCVTSQTFVFVVSFSCSIMSNLFRSVYFISSILESLLVCWPGT